MERIYKEDVLRRAREYVQRLPSGTGAYTNSQGIAFVRQHVADYIQRRDNHPALADDIFLSDGASPAVQAMLRMLIASPRHAVMIPTPQYPLYSASIALLGGAQVGYYLDEDTNWGLSVKELERALQEGLKAGLEVTALVIINPGNPTGQCLTRENMEEIVDFCHRRKLVLLADEVYQENVYVKEAKPFNSFKKVLRNMPSKYHNQELVSFNSVSKGVLGECGKRGGYLEAHAINDDVKQQLYKLASINLCPNAIGQLVVDLMVNPPQAGDPSHGQYEAEKDAIYQSLKRRAAALTAVLKGLQGVTCNPPEGAMYLFPRVVLPPKAIKAAHALGRQPDTHYCISLLDATGLVVVPGSGFGQASGTFHFRTTFLPPEDKLLPVAAKLTDFHNQFMEAHK